MLAPYCKNQNKKGFTLVEISIVMVVIGLLIGGIFGGINLIENANIRKTAQDLQAFDAAALSFRNIYGDLPGDFRNPSNRLLNCTVAPCSLGGNGDGILGTANIGDTTEAMTPTSEKYTFWHQLSAAELITPLQNTDTMEFGEGQPAAPIGGGYRIGWYSTVGTIPLQPSWAGHVLRVMNIPIIIRGAAPAEDIRPYPCKTLRKLDEIMDDGLPRTGKIVTHTNCLTNSADESSPYGNPTLLSSIQFHFSW
jgi:prepilin-type N-terminal cleavage/methylation domain-containing protein